MKFSGGEIEKKKLESTLIVCQLLKSLFDNDSVIIGNPKIDETICRILVPNTFVSENDESHFTVPVSASLDSSQGLSPSTSLLLYTISFKSIDKLQNLLLKGDCIAAIRMKIYDLFQSNGRESLKVLYSLFAGNGPNAACHSPVDPIYSLNASYVAIPVTSAFSPTPINEMQLECLIKWQGALAMIIANRSSGDSQAISALGDIIKRFMRLIFALQLTEIYEFGISLTSNESGLPYLQVYKLMWLVDCGYLNEARRYCESIANIAKVYTKGSPYFHGCFLQKLKDLIQCLLEHGGSNSDTNESSWIFAKKMPKATFDSLWESLEGKFNKFVAGDSVDKIGPFSYYSAIIQPIPSYSVSADSYGSYYGPPDVNSKNISTTTMPPPPLSVGSSRSASSASNCHPVRVRYVDVMNQIPPSN
ncbi:4222_t:CDS:2 [Entrophospora sp. SA101]|nr:4222_t:CDS:2 [Entrophospora sp. SA101]